VPQETDPKEVKDMKRLLIIGLGVALGVGWLVAPASASQPRFVSFQVDRTFVSPSLSAACGFDVTITFEGAVKGTLYTDPSTGTLRELDTQPGATTTVSSAASGKSFSFPDSSVLRYEYVNGVASGAPVTLTVAGLTDKVPGIPTDAGLVTFGSATVLFVDPASGFPIVDFGPPTAFSGHVNDPGSMVAAGCAAIA
jgi:hypothetical protein